MTPYRVEIYDQAVLRWRCVYRYFGLQGAIDTARDLAIRGYRSRVVYSKTGKEI